MQMMQDTPTLAPRPPPNIDSVMTTVVV